MEEKCVNCKISGVPLYLATEYTLEEIKSIDTALAGRIDEMTYHSKIQIREAKERDIRIWR